MTKLPLLLAVIVIAVIVIGVIVIAVIVIGVIVVGVIAIAMECLCPVEAVVVVKFRSLSLRTVLLHRLGGDGDPGWPDVDLVIAVACGVPPDVVVLDCVRAALLAADAIGVAAAGSVVPVGEDVEPGIAVGISRPAEAHGIILARVPLRQCQVSHGLVARLHQAATGKEGRWAGQSLLTGRSAISWSRLLALARQTVGLTLGWNLTLKE